MKKMNPLKKNPPSLNAFRGGSYSLIISAVVLALLVVANVFASALPSAMTKYDISSTKLYSVTSNTKVVVNALEQDVTIYWIVQSGKEDDIIENLLSKYETLSGHIKVVKKNPDVFPTFTEQYTNETVQNNSLIVECGDRSRFIGYDDIYIQEADVYSYSYNTSFDGEGAITSAIDYVVSEELPQLYMLEGHGEAELPATFSEQIEKENIEVSSFSLLTVDSVPEEADCVLIYAPTSDISEEEQKMLANYVTDGGKLLVMAGPTKEGTLKNLYGLLEAYGVEASDGVVIEADREHYAFQAPYVLLPDMAGSDITDSLIEENYFPIMPISQGMKITGSSGNGTVTELLTTSDAAFSKIAGYSLSTYEKEEDDIDGPFSVALSVEANSGGKIVWFASSSFLEDMYNAYSSGANGDMAMNALSSLVGESEAMAIRSKSLNYNYLTISASTSSLLKVMMIGVFPLLYLGIGICVVLTRRKKQNVFGNLTCVFQMKEEEFFSYYADNSNKKPSSKLLETVKSERESIIQRMGELPFSNLWMASKIEGELPRNSVLHLAILNSLRAWNIFETDKTITCYSNTGGFGIDGCLSSFIGAAKSNPEKQFYGVFGDLSLFYDVNSLINSIPRNVHILLVNNGVGTEFKNYSHIASRFGDDADKYIAAKGHNGFKSNTLIKNYAEGCGLTYLSAANKEEFLKEKDEWLICGGVLLEAFTTDFDESKALKLINSVEDGAKIELKNKIENSFVYKVAKKIIRRG